MAQNGSGTGLDKATFSKELKSRLESADQKEWNVKFKCSEPKMDCVCKQTFSNDNCAGSFGMESTKNQYLDGTTKTVNDKVAFVRFLRGTQPQDTAATFVPV